MTRQIHRINAGKDGKLAPDWYDENEQTGWISIGYSVGDPAEMTNEEIRKHDDSPNQQTSRFLGAHENDDYNLHVDDEVIAYAPARQILIGIGTIIGDPDYRKNPDVVLDDPHPHWRKVRWKDWSHPVRLSDLPESLRTGQDKVYPRQSIERYYGDLDLVKRAMQNTELLNFESLTWQLSPES